MTKKQQPMDPPQPDTPGFTNMLDLIHISIWKEPIENVWEGEALTKRKNKTPQKVSGQSLYLSHSEQTNQILALLLEEVGSFPLWRRRESPPKVKLRCATAFNYTPKGLCFVLGLVLFFALVLMWKCSCAVLIKLPLLHHPQCVWHCIQPCNISLILPQLNPGCNSADWSYQVWLKTIKMWAFQDGSARI